MPIINKGVFDIDSVYLREVDNDWPTAQVITTSDVIETTNQYFTNARAITAITPVLTTANVIESTGNLYFTNARAILAEIPAVTQLAVTANGSSAYLLDSYSGNNPTIYVPAGETISFDLNVSGHPFMIRVSSGGSNYSTGLTHVSTDGTESTGSNALSKVAGKLFWKVPYSLAGSTYVYQCSAHAGMVGNIVIQKPVSTITTSDISEGTNLYFTNDRVTANVANLSVGALFDVTISGNLETGQALVYNSNVNAFVPVFVNSEVANVADIAGRVLSLENQTTANVREASSNLYFTNTRVFDAIAFANTTNTKNLNVLGNLTVQNTTIVGNLTGSYILGDSLVTNTSNFATVRSNNADFDTVVIRSNLEVYGDVTTYGANNLVVSDHMIYLNSGSETNNPDIGFTFNYNDGAYKHGGFFHDATDGVFKVFDNYGPEPGSNIFINTDDPTFRLANLQATNYIGNVTGFVTGQVSSIANHNTDELSEGSVNLYHTNARVVTVVTPLLTTANVVETTNHYFTNTKAVTAVTPLLTTANVVENTNQYFTNARVLANVEQMSINVLADVDITDIAVNSVLTWNGTKFIPGATDVALRANFANTSGFANTTGFANVALFANIANLVLSLSNFTTANLTEGNNLYFTNTRARAVFTAGKGIVIQDNGTIKNTGSSPQYNLDINGTSGGNVLASMTTMLTFPTFPTTDRFLLRSIHVVNTTDSTALISGNILYATGNTAFIANKIPVAEGGVLEFIKKGQLFQPGDKINLQGFNSSGTATANLMTAMFTYETFSNDPSFVGIGQTLNASNTNIQIYDSSQSYSIIESIKLVNLENYVVKTKVFWTDANGLPIASIAHNIPLPPNSSLELLQTAKRINFTDKLYASTTSNSQVSVFVSTRLGAVYSIGSYTANVEPGIEISAEFTTTETEGTVLYYTIR